MSKDKCPKCGRVWMSRTITGEGTLLKCYCGNTKFESFDEGEKRE